MTTATLPVPDIRRPQAIDADWLTRALQSAGVDAVVSSFEAAPVGTGQIGDSVRFRLNYARGGAGAPASLVGKFPSANPVSFQTGVGLGNYVREVKFYRELAATALIDTPKWYMAEVDEPTGEFVLLMEDLAPARQGDQLTGVTLDQARAVMDEAAKLHASYWGSESIEGRPWIYASRAAKPIARSEFSTARWREFRERYRDRLAPEVVEAGEGYILGYDKFQALDLGPRCLVHYDFRPDNMMFATPEGGRPVTVLDWQSLACGAGPVDVGYFLAGALKPDVRRAHQDELLTRYHDGLTRLGVRDYSRAELERAYAAGGFRLLMTAYMAAVMVKQTDRGDDMFMQMSEAAAEHILDNDALRLLA